jgi:hypothetical protein
MFPCPAGRRPAKGGQGVAQRLGSEAGRGDLRLVHGPDGRVGDGGWIAGQGRIDRIDLGEIP